MSKILVIEDQVDFQMMIRTMLERNHQVVIASTVNDAQKKINEDDYDLVLLDVTLPDGNGFNLFTQFKAIPKMTDTPIIFLTGKSEVSDRVAGLSLGADDYIVKPFEPLEFVARVEARLKAKKLREEKQTVLKKGRFSLDLAQMKVFVESTTKDEQLDLTPSEFRLFHYFLTHEGHVLTRTQLVNHLWSYKTHVSDRTIDRHVSALRLKLDSNLEKLESVRSMGYRFSFVKERRRDLA